MKEKQHIRKQTLSYRLMVRFAMCMAVLMVLALPLLYLITTHYYAEDLTRLVMKYGVKNTHVDLEEDTLTGMFIQFFSIIMLLLIAVFIVMRYVPRRLWQPFYVTMRRIASFRIEKENVPMLQDSGVSEFDELNRILSTLMTKSVKSYRLQREFTENASHELQTPIAIAQMKIEAMQQDPELTDRQAKNLEDIYIQLRRVSRLSRSLLLLSKIDNSQFKKETQVRLNECIDKLLPQWQTIGGNRIIDFRKHGDAMVTCNEALLESMLTNLVVNAIRHSRDASTVIVETWPEKLAVSNTSDGGALDKEHIFNRFYHSTGRPGYGLGLAIVKSICYFHHWHIDYNFVDGRHIFTVENMK